MPPPSPAFNTALDGLRLDHLDKDLIFGANSHTLGELANEILRNENTSNIERLLLTLTVGMVNQNAILLGELAELKADHQAAEEKTTTTLASLNNRVERTNERVTTLSKKAISPPPPPPALPKTPQPTRPAAPPQQRALAHPAPSSARPKHPANLQQSSDNPATTERWEQVTRARKRARPANTGAKPLPAAQRRFFATRISPEPIESPETLAAELSITFGQLLAAQHHVAPVTSLSVTINQRGAVTVLPPPTVPSSVYAPYFEALTAALNLRIESENTFTTFRPAPTDVDIAIHGLPLFAFQTREELNSKFPEVFKLASGFTPIATRFLHTNDQERNSRKTSTVVVTISADEAAQIGPTIRLLSRPRKCITMWSASPITQCKKCCRFGHPEQGCKQENPTCPICAKEHTKKDHSCPANCSGKRYDSNGCCAAVQPKCINCKGNHASTSNTCPTLIALIETNKARRAPPNQTPAPLVSAPSAQTVSNPMEGVAPTLPISEITAL